MHTLKVTIVAGQSCLKRKYANHVKAGESTEIGLRAGTEVPGIEKC